MPMQKQNDTKSLYFSERITNMMNQFMEYPLTIVEAPMGYGKTTFVRESLKKADADILWHKTYDGDTGGFWSGFCHQMETVNPEQAQRLAALGFPVDSTTRFEAIKLLEEMAFQKNAIVVIDDYHLIASEETNDFITFLIKNEILNFNLVLITRYVDLKEIEELQLKGQLLYLHKEIFEFTCEDIKKYYRLCGISLKDENVKMLHGMTEGWVSALYLIMLNYQQSKKLDTSRNISKLIENAVYRLLPDEVKNMLLSLCLFEVFNLEQAVFVSQNENAGTLLAEVISKNAFVKYDESNKTYQIHNIFMNFLQEELEKQGLQYGLYSRAAKWFVLEGNYNLSQHYNYLNKDFDSIYATIEAERYKSVNYAYKKEMLVTIFRECPKTIKKKYPVAVLMISFELYTYNELAYFEQACGEFLEYLHETVDMDEEERNHLLGEFELLMSFTVYNDIRKMSVHHLKACELMKKTSFLLPREGIWTFGSPSILYMFYRESGKFDEALEAMFEALPHYSRATNGNANGGEYGMKAEGYLYRGDFENALITNYQAIRRAEGCQQVTNIVCSLFLMMRLSLHSGDYARVIELQQQMHKEIERSKEYRLLYTAELCSSYIFALLDETLQVPSWIAEGDYSSEHLLFPNIGMMNIVYGRILLNKGEYHKLIGSFEHFMEMASVFPNLLGQIYAYIYVAAANRKIFRQEEALQLLRTALDLALPDRFYLPFVENYEHVSPLLTELSKESHYGEGIAKITELATSYLKSLDQIKNMYFKDNGPKLSAREMEIAKLAADGLTNKAIGAHLFISENTVKMALKSIYNKYSINSRLKLKEYLETL